VWLGAPVVRFDLPLARCVAVWISICCCPVILASASVQSVCVIPNTSCVSNLSRDGGFQCIIIIYSAATDRNLPPFVALHARLTLVHVTARDDFIATRVRTSHECIWRQPPKVPLVLFAALFQAPVACSGYSCWRSGVCHVPASRSGAITLPELWEACRSGQLAYRAFWPCLGPW
jgi:hypothetical protein